MKFFLHIVLNTFLFLLIFKVDFFGMMPFSIDKFFIIFAGIVLFVFEKQNNYVFFSKKHVYLLIMAVYGVFVSLFYNNEINHQVYRFLLFVIEVYITSFFIVRLYTNVLNKNNIYFFRVFTYCILIQSLLIVISFIQPTIFNFLDILTPLTGSNFDESSFRVFRGISNSSGSAFSVVLSLGVLCHLYVTKAENKNVNLLYILPVFLATAINGRTGILLIVLFLVVYGVIFVKRKNFLKLTFMGIILMIFIPQIVHYFFSNNTRNDKIESWYSEVYQVFDKKTKSNDDVNSFKKNHLILPEKYFNMFFGSGFDPNNYVNGGVSSDSGMIKNVFSFGLILTVLFYFGLVFGIIISGKKINSTVELFFSLGLIMVIIIGEIKEPFLFKTFLGKMVFITLFLRNNYSFGRISF
ncbi:MAG: hypothetical protein ACI9FW_000758 [Flavobacterium sp.]|jgi:hypothetical protein